VNTEENEKSEDASDSSNPDSRVNALKDVKECKTSDNFNQSYSSDNKDYDEKFDEEKGKPQFSKTEKTYQNDDLSDTTSQVKQEKDSEIFEADQDDLWN
jgi:hypothetical protein